MKKYLLLYFTILATQFVVAQIADPQSITSNGVTINNAEENSALFDLQFINNIGATGSTGTNGLTGVLFINNQYWFSRWETDLLYIVSKENEFIEEFTIPGITGARTFSTDGNNVYIGTAESTIYVVDPITKTIVDTIEETSDAVARMVIYDENLDDGNGGFWIGGFDNRIIASIDMTGNELRQITPPFHQTHPYDGVVDYMSEGGPYLWIHDLGPFLEDFIVQIDMETGTRTGVIYNFENDSPGDNRQAGGLFLTNEVDADGDYSFLGVCQCFPSNLLFAVELGEPLGVEENTLSNIQLVPNPVSGSFVTIEGVNKNSPVEIELIDIYGKSIKQETRYHAILSIENLTSGIYLLKVTQDSNTLIKKLVIN